MTIRESCQCGSVEFSLENDPMMHFVCHCSGAKNFMATRFLNTLTRWMTLILPEVRTYLMKVAAGIRCISSRV